MYNVTRINTEFAGLVGWRESSQAGSEYPALTAALKESSTGIYFNDLPMVTLQLINDMAGQDEASTNAYLSNVYTSELNALLRKFIVFQKNRIKTKELLSNFGIGVKNTKIRDLINNNNSFVGFEIIPHKSNSITVEILDLGFQLSEAQDLNIYFYAKSQIDPIKVFGVTVPDAYSLQWVRLEDLSSGSSAAEMAGAIAQYISQNYRVGERYYIGYYQSDLTGRAVDTRLPCSSCGYVLPSAQYGKYVTINSIEVRAGATYTSREIFDTDEVGYTDSTHGLHMKLNVKCDITEVLVANKEMFANSLKYKVGERIMADALGSQALNSVTNSSRERAEANMDRYRGELEHEIKTLNIDFSNIDGECLGGQRNTLSVSNL